MLATSTLRHSRIQGHSPRRASCVSARRNCLERRVAIGSQGSSFVQGPSICLAPCRAADVASVTETLPPYSSLFAAVSISHAGADSNTVGSAGAPVRLSARAGRTSLHHRFASSRAVLARRASVLAWCVAQRIRLDRASEASRDLNRLLDKPGPGERVVAPRKYVLGKTPNE